MTGKYVLPEQDLLEKAAESKRFEYSPMCKELNAQTSRKKQYKKQYKKLGKDFEFDKKEEKMKKMF